MTKRRFKLEEALGCPGWPDCECGLRWLTLQNVIATWEIAKPNKEETEQVAILCWSMLGCISYHCDDPYMRLRAKQQLASMCGARNFSWKMWSNGSGGSRNNDENETRKLVDQVPLLEAQFCSLSPSR